MKNTRFRSIAIATTLLVTTLFVGASALGREDCARMLARLHDSFDRYLSSPQLLEAKFTRPNADELLSLRSDDAAPLYYAVTSDGRLYFSRTPVRSHDHAPAFMVAPGSNATAEVFPIREAGEIRYADELNPSKISRALSFGKARTRKGFIFHQTSGLDPTREEIEQIERQLMGADPTAGTSVTTDYRLVKTFADGGAEARVLECSKFLAKNTQGQKFILDSLINTTGLVTAGIAITAPERFVDVANLNVLAADLVSPGMNSVLRSMASYFMISRNQSSLRRYAVRLGTIGTSVSLQAGLFELFNVDNVKEIGAYTLGYSILMIPKGDLVDRFILQKLPKLAYDSCLNNSAMKFVFSPRSVRLVDGLISTVIFLEGRKALVGI